MGKLVNIIEEMLAVEFQINPSQPPLLIPRKHRHHMALQAVQQLKPLIEQEVIGADDELKHTKGEERDFVIHQTNRDARRNQLRAEQRKRLEEL